MTVLYVMQCINLHRTPTYIVGKPEVDPVAEFLNRWWLPAWLAVRINRWKAVLLGALFYQYCVRWEIASMLSRFTE